MPTPVPPRLRITDVLAVFLISLALVSIQQYRLDAHTAEYGVDAASHYITGTLIHDYLLNWPLAAPLQYLAAYHGQYPLVGIGHWPPVFYVVEAAWMFIAGSSRNAMLLLSALVMAVSASLVYACVARVAGRLLGAGMAMVLLLCPLVLVEGMDLMLDNPIMLACLVAAVAYARYLKTPSLGAGVLFGLCASAAILTKGNALALGLLPPIAILIERRLALLRSFSFWAPAIIAGMLGGLWTVATYGMVAVGFRHEWGLAYMALASRANAMTLWSSVGPLLLLALVGLAATVARHPLARHPICSSAAALWLAVFVFQALVPAAIQDRYMLPTVPAMLILAAVGIRILTERVWRTVGAPRPGADAWPALAMVAACIAPMLSQAIDMPRRQHLDIRAAVEAFERVHSSNNPVVLVAMGADAEAPAIAEIASQDRIRPGNFAIRGSRLLGGGGYNNHEYQPKFESPEQVMAEIDRYRVPYVLLRRSNDVPNEWGHLAQIERAVAMFPLRWQVVHHDTTASVPTILYRVVGNDVLAANKTQLRALSGPKALAGSAN